MLLNVNIIKFMAIKANRAFFEMIALGKKLLHLDMLR